MLAHSRSLTISRFFIGLNALVWLVLGLVIAFNAHPALPDSLLLKGLMAGLSLALAGIMAGMFFLLQKRSRMAYFGAIGFLTITCLLFIFDDFGLADLVALVINIIPLALLIKERAWYLEK